MLSKELCNYKENISIPLLFNMTEAYLVLAFNSVMISYIFHDGVMQYRSKMLYSIVITRWVYTVGQKYNDNALLKIHPKRCSGKA